MRPHGGICRDGLESALGLFVEADTNVPQPGNPLAQNRFASQPVGALGPEGYGLEPVRLGLTARCRALSQRQAVALWTNPGTKVGSVSAAQVIAGERP
jgi:hypothetical protein